MKKNIKKYSGLTLIDVIISISIFTICIAGFSYLFVKSWERNSYVLAMGQASVSASRGVDKMVKYLREARQADNGAYLVKSADDNDLIVYSDYDGDSVTERLHFYKSDNQLLLGITDPSDDSSHSYPEDDQEIITISKNIVNETEEPIFYYYDSDYYGHQADSALTTPVAASSIRMIKIDLEINVNPNKEETSVRMVSLADLRNAR